MSAKTVTLADVDAAVRRLRDGAPNDGDEALLLAFMAHNWTTLQALIAGADDGRLVGRCSWCGRDMREVRVCSNCNKVV